MRIDNNSAVHYFTKLDDKAFTNSKVQVTKSQPCEWGLGTSGNKKIVSYVRYIVRAAINSTPITSPEKQGAQMEARLEAYDSNSEFDYGFRNLSLEEDSEDDEELLDLSDIE